MNTVLMTEGPRRPILPRLEVALCVLTIAVGIVAATAFWLARDSLWEDEIIAITHGLQPLPSFFVEMLRNDIHPFVYFLLLKGWAAVAPGSDRWALASSLLFALLSAACLYHVTARHFGQRAALWACALFCILPNYAWAAGNLRMYSLLPGLAVLTWHLNMRQLSEASAGRGMIMLLVQMLLGYIHAIEVLFLALIALTALWMSVPKLTRANCWSWLRWQALACVLLLPLPLSALFRGTEPLSATTWGSTFAAPAQLVVGWSQSGDPGALAAGSLIFVLLLAAASVTPKGRRLAIGIPVVGLAAALLIGLLGKPLFKPPVFTANLMPFLVMAAGAGFSALPTLWLRGLAMLSLSLLAVVSVPWSQSLIPQNNYEPAARHLVAHVRAGDVVLVPNVSVYWGMLRYAVGPQWGEPLTTLPPSNEAWTRLKQKLRPTWVERLRLDPRTDTVRHADVDYIVGESALAQRPFAGRVWVVQRARYQSLVQLSQPTTSSSVTWFGEELSINLLETDAAGKMKHANPMPAKAAPKAP